MIDPGKRLVYGLVLALLFVVKTSFAQPIPYDARYVDSVTVRLAKAPDDTVKVNTLIRLASMQLFRNPALTIKYATQGDALAEKINYPSGRINALRQLAFHYAVSGEWAKATITINEATPLCEQYKPEAMIYMDNMRVLTEAIKGDNKQALLYAQKAYNNPYFQKQTDINKWPTYMQLGRIHGTLNHIDSAAYYARIVLGLVKKYATVSPNLASDSYVLFGDVALRQKNYAEALRNYKLSTEYPKIANVYQLLGKHDSTVHYALLGLKTGQIRNVPALIYGSAHTLAEEYAESNPREANKYLTIYAESKDKFYNADKQTQFEQIKLAEQRAEYESQQKQATIRNRIIFSSVGAALLFFLITSVTLWRNNQAKRLANQKLEATLTELKNTQNQLIQKEKLASLGELTAGIAHEIQNPLNFVNNFSEVSAELVSELKEEATAGHTEDVLAIADELAQNLQKITHHGGRASNIVKGMLEHSRTTTGERQPTDLNTLAEEYSRLAYQGQLAKDKTFQAELITDFDADLPLISVVAPEIGRVLLNLFNNAFYAIQQRAKQGKAGYHPALTISTRLLKSDPTNSPERATSLARPTGPGIEIRVGDNGTGMPDAVKAKIFQPFFTTKPTGEGTGLGLSLSYDIITKGHGGTLTVESTAGGGTTFTIVLPPAAA